MVTFPPRLFPYLTQLHLWQARTLYLVEDRESNLWLSPGAIPCNHRASHLFRLIANEIVHQAMALRPTSTPSSGSSSPVLLLAYYDTYQDDIIRALQGRLVDLAISGRALPRLPPLLIELLLRQDNALACYYYVDDLIKQGRINEICWIHDEQETAVQHFLTRLVLNLRTLFAPLPSAFLRGG